MTAPSVCERCGAALDAGETCDCMKEEETMAMEFVMGSSLEALPKTIDFNFEQLRDQIRSRIEIYSCMVVTEDGIKGAKEDRARLNKLREALEAKRKEVKKKCMAPYTDFEAKVKELVGLIDQPISAIDDQLKAFEEKRRAEKRAAILEVYEETVGGLRALLPFEKLWRDEWYNTGMSMKKIREAIVAVENQVCSDLEVLSTVESEFLEPVKLKYLENMDLNAALSERARLQEQARRLREYEEQRAKSAANMPEERRAEAAVRGAEQTLTVYRLRFECQVTADEARELSEWLKARNISFRRI